MNQDEMREEEEDNNGGGAEEGDLDKLMVIDEFKNKDDS